MKTRIPSRRRIEKVRKEHIMRRSMTYRQQKKYMGNYFHPSISDTILQKIEQGTYEEFVPEACPHGISAIIFIIVGIMMAMILVAPHMDLLKN